MVVMLAILLLGSSVAHADPYAVVARGYRAALIIRDQTRYPAGPVAAAGLMGALEDQVWEQVDAGASSRDAAQWLALIHDRWGSLQHYFGKEWQKVCADPLVVPQDDADAVRACVEWATCERHDAALSHFALSLQYCQQAGLRPSQYPCSQARGLASLARADLKRCRKQRAKEGR